MKQSPHKRFSTAGFTLIELMAAIVIIGVVTAIAVPVYQNHTARAQFSEANTISIAVRQEAATSYDMNGKCLDNSNAAAGAIEEANSIKGKYVESVTSSTATNGGGKCTVTVAFKSSDINSKLKSKKVIYTLDSNKSTVRWTCSTDVEKAIAEDSCEAKTLPTSNTAPTSESAN